MNVYPCPANKYPYDTRGKAKAAIGKMRARGIDTKGIQAYLCHHGCGHFHLGHKGCLSRDQLRERANDSPQN